MASVMQQFIYFGGITYALGSLTWSIFLPDSNFRNSIVANFVSLGIAVLLFFFPYSAFIKHAENPDTRKYS